MIVSLHRLLAERIGSALGDDLRRKRFVGMLNGVATSLGNRLLSVVIGFVSVPLTIGYLGQERYGAWIAIGAILAWVGLADLGLANGLTNAVTSDASRDRPDRVRMHVSNFLFLMILLCAATGVVLALLWRLPDWQALFGLRNPAVVGEVRTSLAVAVALFLGRLPLAAANRVYIAYQEGHIGNYWGAAGNLLSLAALIAVTRTAGGLPWLVFALTGAPLLVEVASTCWLFGRHRPALRPSWRRIDRSGFGEIVKVGWQFFLIQIMALVTFQTDVLVIARFLGSISVPAYNLTYQLFNYATLPQALLFPYLWAAYNEAIARGDIAWVRRTLRISLAAGTAWSILAVAILIVIARPFIAWWAGANVVPSIELVWLMGLWVVINSAMTSFACLLAAASHLRNQLIYSTLAAVSNLALSLVLVTRVGVEGVIAATILAYLIFVCGPVSLDVRLLLRRLSRRGQAAG
jgi:O-antigen/teichoic acid export membrane protein